ncbi:hypothetical protein [Sulfobacillus thermosulfidooxidans]|uniref:hypothetical protein n=1 Tax=Sulfobacillus thermosulfidooxidans TaxID=28034 RepID=UPI00096BB19B|nr:hypothetical protein [Sulfobacillus thermosulfidooxidans]OLZ09743.1 hypothetical protein BFX05_12395 [Sulfobacillus thermosulfidooxidans]OLZ15950.1 hypothetical protein BFX06_02645 [Sulfobacillus thermosulfidooxidans]OLZ18202.1 hypothetical protein BFX07_07480 [Sulfobacillus thermosulfidooxidans]
MRKTQFMTVISALGAVVAGILIYVTPAAEARGTLPQESAQEIVQRSYAAIRQGNFVETLALTHAPFAADWGPWVHKVMEDPATRLINFYEASPQLWRVDALAMNGKILSTLLANDGKIQLVNPKSQTRMLVSAGANGALPWPIKWMLPTFKQLQEWQVNVGQTMIAGVPCYVVNLVHPRVPVSLSRMTYFFQGRTAEPLGVALYRGRHLEFQAKALVYSSGNPGPTVKGPALLNTYRMTHVEWSKGLVRHIVPEHFGPLTQTHISQWPHQEVIRYGHGLNQVMVVVSSMQSAEAEACRRYHIPVQGYPGFSGMTDGLWSTLSFRYGAHCISVIGDRPLGLLAEWAKSSFFHKL